MSAPCIEGIASRRELLVDEALVDRAEGAALRLHRPVPREVSLETDRPWEGNACAYLTVLKDGDTFRLYYKAWHLDAKRAAEEGKQAMSGPLHIAMAESTDGIRWVRPDLGLVAFDGSRDNNILFPTGDDCPLAAHGFSPFVDPNPDGAPEQRYKAVGARGAQLYAMASPDGLRWSLMQDEPVLTEEKFDSQNLAFYDTVRGEYRAYIRDFYDGVRGILTCTSPDFLDWTDPEWLVYPGAPEEELYTNGVIPYYRAPHLFLGFPTRYIDRGEWSPTIEKLPETAHRRLRAQAHPRYGAALTDGLFMSSRDGRTFKRWGEAFIPPGPQREGNWVYGDNYQCWGMVETQSDRVGAPDDLSVYASEGYWRGDSNIIRRYTLRVDGFVSMNAPLAGGEFVTKPLRFEGARLSLNMATSAAGGLRVALLDENERAIDGFGMDDADESVGDALAYTATWAGRSDVSALAGKPVRLRVALRDADLYAFQFTT